MNVEVMAVNDSSIYSTILRGLSIEAYMDPVKTPFLDNVLSVFQSNSEAKSGIWTSQRDSSVQD